MHTHANSSRHISFHSLSVCVLCFGWGEGFGLPSHIGLYFVYSIFTLEAVNNRNLQMALKKIIPSIVK